MWKQKLWQFLSCRMGMHSWYWHTVHFNRAERCMYCPKFRNKADERRLRRETELWQEAGADDSLDEQEKEEYVGRQLLAENMFRGDWS